MKYVKFKTHKRGIPNKDGGTRTCMHCNRKATVSAVKKGQHVMDVWFCDEHEVTARRMNNDVETVHDWLFTD